MEEWNEGNFDALVGKGDALVFFTAVWCPHCRAMHPAMEETRERHGDVRFAKVDIDRSPALAARFRVRSIPQLLFFKDGKMTDRLVGFRNARQVGAFVEEQRETVKL